MLASEVITNGKTTQTAYSEVQREQDPDFIESQGNERDVHIGEIISTKVLKSERPMISKKEEK